ncbi:hypothetical protein [Nostoc sp. FACHB-145]|uniref:hypothetical protein n=1 Tax=Nostoc sp. FACHB-145 TaxID=2692836 RepID=UPI001688550A|nr:hypothetical protein [Nostoc sp. FACHB-145]MBD2468738.1 hypothetical protein [Nostoc sp. FACHB-145]
MSKVVAGKSLKKNYTSISNELIRSSQIDDSTFRLICWMTSHEEGFEINFASIQNALGYGRDKLRKILKNAETLNYLVRRKIRTNGGLFDFEYHIFKDNEDAQAFRESLPQEELTTDLFSGGGSTRGVKTGGGSTGGGSARGGESTPLLEKQYRENQKEENHWREEPLSVSNDLIGVEDFSSKQTPLPQPLNPTSQPQPHLEQKISDFSSLSNSDSSFQTEDPTSGSKVGGLFDNYEQTNIVPFPDVAERSARDTAKLQKYQQLDAKGITLKKPELVDWASLEIGSYVKTYRKSGCILTGGNDVSHEFAVYVASQNCKQRQEPTITLGFNVINKSEADPRCWQKLVAWVMEWQQQRQTGQTVNVAAAVDHQQELERIRQATARKFEL